MDNNDLFVQDSIELNGFATLYKVFDKVENKTIYVTTCVSNTSPVSIHTQIV